MDEVTLARMVRRLRGYRTGTHYSYMTHSWVQGKRRFTDEEICEALNISNARMKALIASIAPRQWDTISVKKAFVTFVDKNKRWPRYRDWRDKSTGLPYWETMQQWYGYDRAELEYAMSNWRSLSPEMVFGIRNATTRRNVINQIGIEKLIKQGVLVQQDDFGVLWELPFQDESDSKARYVEVTNSTPRLNKNGRVIKRNGEPVYDHYFLRVPPTTRSAHEAVAWTFDKDPGEFVGFAAQS